MKNAYAEFQILHRAWKMLRDARKSEIDLTPFGLKGGNAEDFDGLFSEWETALSASAAKTKPVGPEDKALESIVVSVITQLTGWVTAAPSNGYPWLFQTGFPTKISELNTALTPILDRRFRVRKAVIDGAQSDLNDNIIRVESAAPLADTLVAQQATITQQASEVADALQEAQTAKEQVAAEAKQVADHLSVVQQLAESATSANTQYQKIVDGASTLLDEAQSTLESIQVSRVQADTEIDGGTRLVAAANAKITKAIADLNRQGLAGSFARSANRLIAERVGWLLAFGVAIGYLIWIAGQVFSESSVVQAGADLATTAASKLGAVDPAQATLGTANFWERILHFIPLAAPGIWLGWFSARNASLIARIQQDYDYKVATAQAFEAYKKEVEQVEDDALTKQLLETTIRNFGDNPIRIYDGKGFEGHPLETLKSLMDGKDWEKFLKLLEAIKPTPKS
jgi:hypothetical protein